MDLKTILWEAFAQLWQGLVLYAPRIIVALVIFILGWIIAAWVSQVIGQLFRMLKVDHALKAAGVEGAVKRAGFELNSGVFVGELVRWFVIVASLVAVFNILGLYQVNQFLTLVVLNYIPDVIAAVLILLVAAMLSEAVKKVISGAANAAGVKSAKMAGSVSKWAIWIFAILVALDRLGIAGGFIQTLFTGIIVAVAIALGLAFGLGGQEAAARAIEKVRGEIADRG